MRFEIAKGFNHPDRNMDDLLNRIVKRTRDAQGDITEQFDHPEGMAAGEPFAVRHDLGEVPTMFHVVAEGNVAAQFYATEDDKEGWTDKVIIVRCSTDQAKRVRLRVIGRIE